MSMSKMEIESSLEIQKRRDRQTRTNIRIKEIERARHVENVANQKCIDTGSAEGIEIQNCKDLETRDSLIERHRIKRQR